MAFVTSFLGATLASRATAPVGAVSRRGAARVRMAAEMSKAVPFLEKPPKLNGTLPGDVGFDPLGFSNFFDLNFLRESEGAYNRAAHPRTH